MKASCGMVLVLALLAALAGSGAAAAVLSSESRSLQYMGACGDGKGGAWILAGEMLEPLEDTLAVSAWRMPRDGEPREIGRVDLPDGDGRGPPGLGFARCLPEAGGATAFVQVGGWLEEHALSEGRATLRRRIDLDEMERRDPAVRDVGSVTAQFVARVGGRLLLVTSSVWLEGERGFAIVKPAGELWEPSVEPWSFSADAEHLYYVESAETPAEAAVSRGEDGWGHSRKIRLVRERVAASGVTRTAESEPFDAPEHLPEAEFRWPPLHLTMADSKRVRVLSYYGGSGRFLLRSGTVPPAAASGVAGIELGLRADARFPRGMSVIASWARLGDSVHVAHHKLLPSRQALGSMLLVVDVAADGSTRTQDIPMPPEFESDMGATLLAFGLVASGDRLLLLSTIMVPSTTAQSSSVVSIHRVR